MQFRVVHYGRKWRRADNHMDARHCPECGATVHGNRGQHAHREWHNELAGVLESLSQRAGIEPETSPEWTAAIDEHEQEAITG